MRIFLFSLIMIFSNAAFAGLYKWTDEDGNIHYSQNPPFGKSYKTLKAPPPAPEVEADTDDDVTTRGSNAEKTIKAETKKNQKLREKNCNIGKNNLKSFQTFRSIRDKKGNIKVISDKERAKNIESAKKIIREFCD